MGAIGDNPYGGSVDIFLTKLASDRTRLWSRQWGNDGFDDPSAAAVDSHNNIYIANCPCHSSPVAQLGQHLACP